MKLHEILQLLIAVTIPLVAAIWYLADIKSQIYKYIDVAFQSRDIRLNQLEKDVAIHLRLYEERTEFVDYHINDIRNTVDHKSKRLLEEIKALRNENSN